MTVDHIGVDHDKVSDDTLVLASLNLHAGRDRRGAPFDVAAALRALAADVVVVQEVWHPVGGPDPVAAAAAALGVRAVRADLLTTDLVGLGIAADPAPGLWGLALLCTLPITCQEVVDLGRAPRDVCRRGALVVTVTLPAGGRLRIAGTHLSHRFPGSVRQLRRLAAHLAGGTAPAVIVGDLNMPGPATVAAPGYARAVRGATFPAHRPLIELDHVLTGPGVRALGGEVLPASGSDHRPVRVRLRLS